MEDGKQLWSIWQALLSCQRGLPARDSALCSHGASGTVLVIIIHHHPPGGRALADRARAQLREHFAEYGATDQLQSKRRR